MKNDVSAPPVVLGPPDVLLGFVPLTPRRAIAVYLHEYHGQQSVKLGTFARHRKQGYWYRTRMFFSVRIESAAELGRAFIEAGAGRPFGDTPAWWADYQAQYEEWRARKAAEAPHEGPNAHVTSNS